MKAKLLCLGGWNNGSLKSVEAYDYYENKWAYLPGMIEKRDNHASVSTSNKLFVIGGSENLTCEIFDCCSRKFSYIKTCIDFNNLSFFQAVCLSNQIITFSAVSGKRQTKQFTFTKIVYVQC